MRLLIQRVLNAEVNIENLAYSKIGKGLLVLVGFHPTDTDDQLIAMKHKLIHLRIFNDSNNKMNLSLKETSAELMVVSQFTLYANYTSGRRPDYLQAAPSQLAKPLYEQFIRYLSHEIKDVKTGQFGKHMQIQLTNDGPVTLFLDSDKIN